MNPLSLAAPTDGRVPPPAVIGAQPRAVRPGEATAAQPADATDPAGTSALIVDGVLTGELRDPDGGRPTMTGQGMVPVPNASPGPIAMPVIGTEPRPARHPAGPRLDISPRFPWWPRMNGRQDHQGQVIASTPATGSADPRPQVGMTWRAMPAPHDSDLLIGYRPAP